MSRPYTILINRGLNKVMVLDNFKVRYNRMRKRVADWVEILSPMPDIMFVMLTLTYAPENDWEPNHVREFMLSYRKALGQNLLAYAWVAELQKRGLSIITLCWLSLKFYQLVMIFHIQILQDSGLMDLHVSKRQGHLFILSLI